MKKVLVTGGTGALGQYAVSELLNCGYSVDVLSLDEVKSDNQNLKFIVGNGLDIEFVRNLLKKNKYDGIVDFMLYNTAQFAERFQMLLESTKHYIFLSSYRVYAQDDVITESSPRLLDVSNDREYRESEDYSLFKARCENILRASKYHNWTIVRPSICYSIKRYQLITWEANILIPRILEGKKIIVPKEAYNVESAMTFAGDAGKMFARLLFNEKAFCETYTLSTAEHNPWSYVAQCYTELLGAQFEWVDRETYLKIRSGGSNIDKTAAYQLDYDRLLNRVIDNSKILAHTGLKQDDLMPLKEGLKTVLDAVNLKEIKWNTPKAVDEAMDRYLKGK